MTEVTAPTHKQLLLDTTTLIYATDENGTQLFDDETGKPIHIALDLITGKWFRKWGDSLPFNGPKKATHLDLLIDRGAIHVSHADERFRGVWIPMLAAEEDEEFEAEVPTHDADGKPVVDKDTGKPVTKRMVVKKAAKKVAKKTAGRHVN